MLLNEWEHFAVADLPFVTLSCEVPVLQLLRFIQYSFLSLTF